MMLSAFTEFMNTTVQIVGFTNTGTVDEGGNPATSEVTRYSGKAAFWRLTSSELYRLDRVGNPSQWGLVLYPDQISGTIDANGDIARIGGIEYKVHPGEGDIMGMGDVAYYTLEKQDD